MSDRYFTIEFDCGEGDYDHEGYARIYHRYHPNNKKNKGPKMSGVLFDKVPDQSEFICRKCGIRQDNPDDKRGDF